jgi:hypothetical protein
MPVLVEMGLRAVAVNLERRHHRILDLNDALQRRCPEIPLVS